MTATGNVTTCNADHDRRWLATGCDGAWPNPRADLPQRPSRLAAPCVIDKEIARRIAIARSDHIVRPACHLPTMPGATVKSP